jgi:DNA polymerase III sliding clamp (beta) subunit (PCNA family)
MYSFKSTSKIVEATSKDTTRDALTHIEVKAKDDSTVYLTATDAKIAVVRVEQGEVDGTKLVPNSVLSKAAKPDVIELTGDNWVNHTTDKFCKDDNGSCPQYPDICQVMPDSIEEPTIISLDTDLIARLAKALLDKDKRGIKGLTFIIPKKAGKPIGVLAQSLSEHAFGVIMPLRIEDEERIAKQFESMVSNYKQPKGE